MPTQIPGTLNQKNIIDLIVVSAAVCVLCSVTCFIVGIICRCRHCCPKQTREHTKATKESALSQLESQDVELQENAAYISVQL